MTKMNTNPQRGKTAEQRFAEKHGTGDGCWNWESARNTKGYGIFFVDKSRPCENAHRFALELKLGRRLKAGTTVMHSCDNPSCVNPSHLSEGTPLANMLDAKAKGRIASGERNGGGGKLKAAEVREIYDSKNSISGAEAARRFGVSRYLANAIRRGIVWQSVTGAAHG